MPLLATVALVIALVALRLLLPPVPAFWSTYSRRWGKRTMILLCSMSLAGAAVLIFFSRH